MPGELVSQFGREAQGQHLLVAASTSANRRAEAESSVCGTVAQTRSDNVQFGNGWSRRIVNVARRVLGDWMRRASTLVGLASVLVLAMSAPPSNSAQRIDLQARLNPDGSGRLLVTASSGSWAWEACAADLTDCIPFGHGREIATGNAPAGSVFRVRSGNAVAVSPEWGGRAKSLKAPSVEGPIRANDFVSPVPGVWSGGWQGELSEMQLSACATSDGQHCISLTDRHFERQCAASASFALDARYAGTYLRVAQRRIGAGPLLEPSFATTSPYGAEVWGRSRITSAVVVGQIAPAISAFAGECGPPPRGRAQISSQGVALIECPAGCRAALVGSGDGRRVRIARRLPARDALLVAAPNRLRVPLQTLGDFESMRLKLIVEIDGKQVAQRTL